MPRECGHSFDKLLVVEGENDRHVTYAIRDFHHVAENFDVCARDGWQDAINFFDAQIIATDKPRCKLGIIIDANSDYRSRWKTIHSRILDKYTSFPDTPEVGIVVDADDPDLYPTIGVWLMPNCQRNGTLEDFLLDMVEETNPETCEYVGNIINQARTDKIATCTENQQSKAIMHTWLAWQNEPGSPMGRSITAGNIQPTTDDCLRFVDWLKTLFNT